MANDQFLLDTCSIDTLDTSIFDEDPLSLFTQHSANSYPIVHTSFRPRSIFNPSHAKCPYLESFYRVVYADLLKLCQTSDLSKTNNLSPPEIKSLQFLTEAKVIKLADKRGGIVLQNKDDYMWEAKRLLSDGTMYMKIAKDPTLDFR